jgi:hypothetical protein
MGFFPLSALKIKFDHQFRHPNQIRGLAKMYIFLSLLVAIVGVLMYVLTANPKLSEVGRISFAFGLLAFLLQVGSVHIGFPR